MHNKIKVFLPLIVLSLTVLGCTGNFEKYNTDPHGPTTDQMKGDNVLAGTYLANMMVSLCQIQQNNSQMIEQLIGSEYGAMTTPPRTWANGSNVNYASFSPTESNCSVPFEEIMPQISTGYFKLKEFTGGEGELFAIATILRVAGTHRLSDIYGPVPYSKVDGKSFRVPYDSEEELYGFMLGDLDTAISILLPQAAAGVINSTIAEQDPIFGGDYKRWVKFANTLKLRMAIRMKEVKPDLARQVVEEVEKNDIGAMSEAGDAAWTSRNDGMNPYYRAAYSWDKDLRINANIVAYLKAYNDPRLSKYATKASSDDYVGVYPGTADGENDRTCLDLSNINIGENDPQLVMSAAEASFLEAEAALKGWWTKNTAMDLYLNGIRISMQERGCDIGSYLDTMSPGNIQYNNGRNSGTISNVPAVKAGGTPTLQQIITQKWLANFPNGWETWADIRRTGFPNLLPAVKTNSYAGVYSIKEMHRLTFSTNEYNTNEENVKAAVGMLKDPDDAFKSRLWWQQ